MNLTPILDPAGGFFYRHYRISAHAVDRYRERISESVEKLFEDLDSAFLLDPSRTFGRLKYTMQHNEKLGGYGLMSGEAVFLILPQHDRHNITTIITARQPDGSRNYR